MVASRLHRTRRTGRKRRLFAIALLIGAVAWTAGLIVFASRIPETVADPGARTDAIVVLTGGSKRVDTGLQLLADHKAERVFVSGVHAAVDIGQLLDQGPRDAANLACCVDAGHGAVNTAGNATEAAAWMRRHGYRTLRLVTASYHMPRSLLEFRYRLPEAEVVPHPVFSDDVKVDRWWLWPGTAALIVSEYNKYLLAWVRQALARAIGVR